MSFKLLTTLISKQVHDKSSKLQSFFGKEKERFDTHNITHENLNRLHIGDMAEFTKNFADALILETEGGIYKLPQTMLHCTAYSKLSRSLIIDDDYIIHRFYLESNVANAILQLITKDGQLLEGETKLLCPVTDYTPLDKADWNTWLKYEPGDPPLLGGLYLTWEGSEYTRHWGVNQEGNSPEYINPRNYTETLFHDPYTPPITITRDTMLYSRKLGESEEYLQVSCMTTPNEKWIEAMVGISISPDNITVISE